MAQGKDPGEPAASTSITAGSVALLPEPFTIDEEAVSLAARAARDALMRLNTGRARRPLRREQPSSPSAPVEPLPALPKAAP